MTTNVAGDSSPLMSTWKQSATLLAALQEDLERATARCITITRHTNDAHQAATTAGSATAIGDAEDIQTAVAVLGQHLTRALTTASITADTIRTVIHDDPDN